MLLGYLLRRRIKSRFIELGLIILWFGARITSILRSSQAQGVTILSSGYVDDYISSRGKNLTGTIDCSGSGYQDSEENVRVWMILHNHKKIVL